MLVMREKCHCLERRASSAKEKPATPKITGNTLGRWLRVAAAVYRVPDSSCEGVTVSVAFILGGGSTVRPKRIACRTDDSMVVGGDGRAGSEALVAAGFC